MVRFWDVQEDPVKEGDTIAVWFSCGAASAMAARKIVDKYKGKAHIRVVNNPVVEEHPDNKRFFEDVQSWLGIEIEYAINPEYPTCSAYDVWEKRKYMSGPQWAPCTHYLKRLARRMWEEQNKVDWHVLGFTFEEKRRSDRFKLGERSNILPILVDNKITKHTCLRSILNAGIKPSAMYGLGFPNANCIGCVKASSPTYWNLVRRLFPDVFDARVEQSDRTGDKLVKLHGNRIPLRQLSPNDAGGRLKDLSWECSSFCEER